MNTRNDEERFVSLIMKKYIVLLSILLIILSVFACVDSFSNTNLKKQILELQKENESLKSQTQVEKSTTYYSGYSGENYTNSSKKSSSSSYSYSYSSGSFSNKYGTASTKCAHTGCNNYIASSGDTNCCVIHSNKCLSCGCYIDEDAMYCVSCILAAAMVNAANK